MVMLQMQIISIYVYFNDFRKNQRNEIDIFSRKCNSIINDGKSSRSKSWTNKYTINKLKSAAKSKTGIILRLNKKNFEVEELPHELLLITRQTTKIRNALANNMSRDTKLRKAQISKIHVSFLWA